MITNKEISNEYSTFSYNVKCSRKKLHYTQTELANISKLSISYIKQIESTNDYSNVTFVTLSKLSKALNVSIHDLFTKKTH